MCPGTCHKYALTMHARIDNEYALPMHETLVHSLTHTINTTGESLPKLCLNDQLYPVRA